MKCPACLKGKLRTRDSRECRSFITKRIRECRLCGERIVTWEIIKGRLDNVVAAYQAEQLRQSGEKFPSTYSAVDVQGSHFQASYAQEREKVNGAIPSLDGPGLKPFVALLFGDYPPQQCLEIIGPFASCSLASADYNTPTQGAAMLFRVASHLGVEDCEVSLILMRKAKELWREAVKLILARRICPCCVALQNRLKESKKGDP